VGLIHRIVVIRQGGYEIVGHWPDRDEILAGLVRYYHRHCQCDPDFVDVEAWQVARQDEPPTRLPLEPRRRSG
jgi:hypothetical protein